MIGKIIMRYNFFIEIYIFVIKKKEIYIFFKVIISIDFCKYMQISIKSIKSLTRAFLSGSSGSRAIKLKKISIVIPT